MLNPAPTPAIRTTCCADLAAVEAHTDEWDALAAAVPQRLPMLASGWVLPLLEQRTPEGWSWVVVFAWADQRLVGVLPVFVEPSRPLGLLRPRLAVPCSYNTLAGDILLAPDVAPAALDALLQGVRSHAKAPLRLDLGCMRESSPTFACVQQGIPGWMAVRAAANDGASIRIAGDYGEWFQALSKSLRRDMRRGENKMSREELGEPVFEFVRGVDATPDRLDELMAIEATTWKGEEGGAIVSDPSREARYRAIAERFHACGWLEWQFMRVGGRLIAANMVIRVGRSQMLLRMAYNGEFARLQGGQLLLREMVRRAFEAGDVDDVNFVNYHPWCRRWNAHVEPYHNLALAPKRPLPFFWGLGPRLNRSMARRIPGLRRLVRWVRGRFQKRN
ncbi:MAG: GNAT family N-acetyltransferase [Planctomycetota bacterium]|nr:GNAT family N-acetyltransferase [Planctomycetota bacterium]